MSSRNSGANLSEIKDAVEKGNAIVALTAIPSTEIARDGLRQHPAQPLPRTTATDLISDLLSHIIAMAPGFTAAMAAQVEHEAREKWGGDRVYVQRKGNILRQRNAAIKRDYQAGERIAQLSIRYQLSVPRLWEIIGS